MSRLEEQYHASDTAEERRIIMAVIAAALIIGLLISVAINIVLFAKLSQIPA